MKALDRYRFKPQFISSILITVVLILIYRIGIQIQIPFLNSDAINEYFKTYKVFDSSYLGRFSIFSLGVMPYVSAYVLVEIFSLFIPLLKKLRTGDFKGRLRLKQIALGLTLLLGVLQASGIISGLRKMSLSEGIQILDIGNSFEYVLLVGILVASLYFLIIIAELISKFGIGHGISILIFSGICADFSKSMKKSLTIFNEFELMMYLFLGAILFLITISAVLLLRTKISIPVTHRRSQKSLDIFQFNTCPSGDAAFTYAASIILFPMTILSFFDTGHNFLNSFRPGTLLYSTFFVLLVFGLSYLFAWLFFHPKRRIIKMKETGWQFSNPEMVSENYLRRRLFIYNLPWMLFLCALGVLPNILITSFKIPFYIGGSSLYIAVAIGLDVLDRCHFQQQTGSSRVVKIAEFHDIYDASMIKKQLASEGIRCHLQGYYHRHLLYFFGPYIDVGMMVAKEDVEFCCGIIKRYYNGLGLLN